MGGGTGATMAVATGETGRRLVFYITARHPTTRRANAGLDVIVGDAGLHARLTLVIMSSWVPSILLLNRNTSELWACAAMAGRPAIGPHARYLIIVPESSHHTRLAHEPDARARSLGAAFSNS